MNTEVSQLYELVTTRMNEVGVSRRELIERCGYKNTAKGLRHLDAIWEGALGDSTSTRILTAIRMVLNLDPSVFEATLNESRRRLEQSARKIEEEREAAWREAFQPEAYLVGTYTRPTQITIFGITGGHERWHRIELDLAQPPVTFAEQALAVARRSPQAPFFGPTTGFVVNYTPDRAVRFDLDGNPTEVLPRAYSGYGVTVSMGERPIDIAAFSRLPGFDAAE